MLLETKNPVFEQARDAIALFAELEKSPEHFHTYRITPISLWNAAAAGLSSEAVIDALDRYNKYDVPQNVTSDVRDYVSRYGRLKLTRDDEARLVLSADDPLLMEEIVRTKGTSQYVESRLDDTSVEVRPFQRGRIKQALIKIGYPVEDLAGYKEGDRLDMSLRDTMLSGPPLMLRPYQQSAIDSYYLDGSPLGGSGVIALPCGAGKTLVAMGVMARAKTSTLIVATNIVAVRQWRDELIDKMDLDPGLIGEYSGEEKTVRPVTIATYQILTYRRARYEEFLHFGLFDRRNWGLIVYDEVHLLPAPVFRVAADLQATRRLGLTATLVREDGREDDVFSLIGPKRYDVPWKVLERQGWIAQARCVELRVPLVDELRMQYAVAATRIKYRVAATNPRKMDVVRSLLEKHKDDSVLVIGQYLDQLKKIASLVSAPLITGKMPNTEREELYSRFRSGDVKLLVVSKVANFAIDLPDANVAIQVSGTFGSRQEEAQRLGRILRPKSQGNQAIFYSLVTRDTRDQEFCQKRQLFLTEQGYRYEVQNVQ
jgi:DNA excision repair protein ERCC-3